MLAMVLVFLDILQYHIEKLVIGTMSPGHNIPIKQIYLKKKNAAPLMA